MKSIDKTAKSIVAFDSINYGVYLDTRYHITQDKQKRDVQSVHLEKDLGVLTSADLAVSHQCMEAASKTWRVLGMVRRQFKELDAQSFVIIYKGFDIPHLEYAIQAWSPYLCRDIDCMEKVQRRATKMVKGFYKLPYETRLKLTSLEKRRQRGDLIEAYKILTGKEGVDTSVSSQWIRIGTAQGNTS